MRWERRKINGEKLKGFGGGGEAECNGNRKITFKWVYSLFSGTESG